MLTHKRNIYFLCALTGGAIFVLIYGVLPLNVSYDAWIFNDYIETDIVQRYAGWLAYRNADTFFPLTFSNLINYPFGDYTSLADSIPAAEILFKLLSPVLPTVFQFCGILSFFNLVAQGLCGAMLIGLFEKSKWKIYFGGVFFCLSPILIERLFRHTSLSFHWIILLAIYFYFKGKRDKSIIISIAFTVILVLSVYLHIYLTPIVAGFFLAYILDTYKLRKTAWPHLGAYTIGLGLCVLSAFALGVLNMGSQNTSGYGLMGMNINAIFNPVSLDTNFWVEGLGKLAWSAFLPMRALAQNNIESFNYLGVGALLGLCALCGIIIYRVITQKNKATSALVSLGKQHAFLILFLLFSTFFAISNIICAFSYVVLEIPLPSFLLSIFNAFRASGRLFWSVNYMLVLCAVLAVGKLWLHKKRLNYVLVVGMVLVQLVDLSPAIAQKQQRFVKQETYHNQANVDEVLSLAQNSDAVYYLELKDSRALCAALVKNNIANNLWLISRDGYNMDKIKPEMHRVQAALLRGEPPYSNCIYATENEQLAQKIVNANNDMQAKKIDGIFYLID